MRFLLGTAVAAALTLALPGRANAQFIPDRGPSSEQQEFASALLLGPEATVLGAFLVGGGAYLVTRECCTEEGDDVAIEPMAVGAGVGAAIGTAWAVRTILDHYHPGSGRNLVIGAVVGAGAGAGLFFGGPAEEDSNDAVLRLVSFLFLPTLASYAGWHLDPNGFYMAEAGVPPVAAAHVGPVQERRGTKVAALTFRF